MHQSGQCRLTEKYILTSPQGTLRVSREWTGRVPKGNIRHLSDGDISVPSSPHFRLVSVSQHSESGHPPTPIQPSHNSHSSPLRCCFFTSTKRTLGGQSHRVRVRTVLPKSCRDWLNQATPPRHIPRQGCSAMPLIGSGKYLAIGQRAD